MTAAATLGATTFSILVWGSILLVLAVFGYVVRALLLDRTTRRS